MTRSFLPSQTTTTENVKKTTYCVFDNDALPPQSNVKFVKLVSSESVVPDDVHSPVIVKLLFDCGHLTYEDRRAAIAAEADLTLDTQSAFAKVFLLGTRLHLMIMCGSHLLVSAVVQGRFFYVGGHTRYHSGPCSAMKEFKFLSVEKASHDDP